MNIYERIGFKGLAKVVWESSSLLSSPKYLYVYYRIFTRSRTLRDVLNYHDNVYFNPFGDLSSKYPKVKKVLQGYKIEWLLRKLHRKFIEKEIEKIFLWENYKSSF